MAKKQEELEQFVNELNQEEEQQYQPFIVTDLESATEAGRRISYFNEQMAEIDEITKKQIQPFLDKVEKIKEWGEQAKGEYVDKVHHYEHMLEAYWREEVAKNSKKKTLKLPYGSISLKKQQPQFNKDEEQLLEYAKENGFVKVKESADWTAIKKSCHVVDGKLIDENGEVLPVQVVERGDKFELKLD